MPVLVYGVKEPGCLQRTRSLQVGRTKELARVSNRLCPPLPPPILNEIRFTLLGGRGGGGYLDLAAKKNQIRLYRNRKKNVRRIEHTCIMILHNIYATSTPRAPPPLPKQIFCCFVSFHNISAQCCGSGSCLSL